MQAGDYSLDNMQTSDLEEVLTIERQVQVMPWARLSFEQSLSRDDFCRVVRVRANTVAAFHVCSSVMDEMHLLNIGVGAESQGVGLGHFLLQDIVAIATENKAKKIFLEVRKSNVTAQSLYEKWQFRQIAVRKNYYRTRDQQREDALVCVRLL